jgi:hypothetical protein
MELICDLVGAAVVKAVAMAVASQAVVVGVSLLSVLALD